MFCKFLFAMTAATAVVGAFNDDKPIYKWSPVWLSSPYDKYPIKRYKEERPIYKWSPSWLYGQGYVGKRSAICSPALAACSLSATGQCCPGLDCVPSVFVESQMTTDRFICVLSDTEQR